MQFRLTTAVDGLYLHGRRRDNPISLRVSHPRQMDVVISLERGEGVRRYAERALVTATCSVEPNPRVAAGFGALSRGEFPEGMRPEALENWRRFIDQEGKVQRNTLLPQTGLPEPMVSFIRAIRSDLTSAVRRVSRLVRWRHALEGSHDPLRSFNFGPEWSLDSREWYLLPGNTGARAEILPTLEVADATAGELQAFVDSHLEEPVAHQLLREALDVQHSNRRSALVIGVAALEVGVKNCIAELLPGAEWLVTNMPSPSIKRLLTEYLPTLPVRLKIAGEVKSPPEPVALQLDRAVFIRNRVAHATGEDIDHNALEAMLDAISDVLWLLDFYRGEEWALDHMSDETQRALGIGHRPAG